MKYVFGDRPHYEVEKLIGEGLTGQVYRAYRCDSRRLTKQLVALKILKSKKDVPVLKQEFKKLQALKSPYCVNLIAWENIRGSAALVLEYLDGLTLWEVLRSEELPLNLVDEICGQVQQGLQDLKSQGLYHGDLTPKNIFICKDGGIKLIDFGVLNEDDQQMGVPMFMAPERQQGRPPTWASDLFSLGVIRHMAITGQWQTTQDPTTFHSKIIGTHPLLARFPQDRQASLAKSDDVRKKRLSRKVQDIIKKRQNRFLTRRFESIKPTKKKMGKWSAAVLVFFALFFSNPEAESRFDGATIDVRAQNWAQIKINNGPTQYVPIYIDNFRPGKYQLTWSHPLGAELQTVEVPPGSQLKLIIKGDEAIIKH